MSREVDPRARVKLISYAARDSFATLTRPTSRGYAKLHTIIIIVASR